MQGRGCEIPFSLGNITAVGAGLKPAPTTRRKPPRIEMLALSRPSRLEHPERRFLPQQQLPAVGHGGLAHEGVGRHCVGVAEEAVYR